MHITIKAVVGAGLTTLPVDVNPSDIVKSVIIEFCLETGMAATDNMQMKDDNGKIIDKESNLAEAGVHNGDTVYIAECQPRPARSEENVRVRTRPVMKKPGLSLLLVILIGFIFVSGSVSGLIALFVKFTDEICIDEGYGVVFDAGSSHTNLTIYNWPAESVINGTGVVTQQGTCQTGGGGISSYEDNPQEAGPSLTDCLNYAETVIPSQYYNSTSLHLGATAGMRLLNATQPATSNAIMDSVRSTMAGHPFSFSPDQAVIISGSNEGTYGWVATNFLSGTLRPDSLSGRLMSVLFADQPVTYGALDLGGASTQITFIPEDPSSMPPEYTSHVRLYGVDYKIYTHSYLCYGVNEAIRRFKAKLVAENGDAEVTVNPCAPKGFSEIKDGEYLWKAPCVNGSQALTSWGSRLSPPDPRAPDVYNLTGTGDYEGCKEAVEELFNFNATCKQQPCSFNGVYQPKPYGKFLAFSTFQALIHGLGLSETASIKDILSAAKSFCAKSYDEIKTMPGNLQYLVLYCFEINYVSSLLLKGYHFNESTWDIEFTGEVQGKELGWSLGFMINATNMIPTESSCTHFSQVGFYVGIAVLFVFLILGVFALVFAVCKCARLSDGSNYEEFI